MDLRTSLDGLKSLLGTTPASAASTPQNRSVTNSSGASVINSDSATLSSAGSVVSLASSESDVRMDKVASVQAALAAGSYSVPASALASKLVDVMLGSQR